jgi:hypothetical protein
MPLAARAATLVTLLALPASRARAEGLEALEVFTSTIFQQHQSSFSGIGLRMRVGPPQLMQGFSILPSVEYWRNTNRVDAFAIETTRKDATLATFLRFDWSREGWQPFVGVGLGLHFLSSEVDAPSLGLSDESDSVVRGGVAWLAGVKFGLAGRLGNLIEVEHHYVPDQSQLKLNWGLSYDFVP